MQDLCAHALYAAAVGHRKQSGTQNQFIIIFFDFDVPVGHRALRPGGQSKAPAGRAPGHGCSHSVTRRHFFESGIMQHSQSEGDGQRNASDLRSCIHNLRSLHFAVDSGVDRVLLPAIDIQPGAIMHDRSRITHSLYCPSGA